VLILIQQQEQILFQLIDPTMLVNAVLNVRYLDFILMLVLLFEFHFYLFFSFNFSFLFLFTSNDPPGNRVIDKVYELE
jgi:hypothetical protein